MIAIIDYGLGNVQAFANIYKNLDIPVSLAKNATELLDATHFILPGVGAFDWAMDRLNESGMRSTLDRLVIKEKKPVLGVCVGMQIMAEKSEEGSASGLGWFDAKVIRLGESTDPEELPLPHMGWNEVHPENDHGLFEQLERDSRFYFLHSYYFSPSFSDDIFAMSDYAQSFPSAVNRGNIFGVQFHPEKSHGAGIQLLKNFASL